MASRKSVAGIPGKDPTLPNVPLELNGKVYHLAFSFNAMAKVEELTGLKLLNAIEFNDLSVTQYRALLFSALLTENPDITLEEVGNLINLKTLAPITVALVHAWTGSQPEVVALGKDENPPVEQPAQS